MQLELEYNFIPADNCSARIDAKGTQTADKRLRFKSGW